MSHRANPDVHTSLTSEGFLLPRLPLLPDLSYEFGAWFECRFAWAPSCRSGLRSLAVSHMLESSDLPDQFLEVSSYGWGHDLHGLDDAIRVNQKPSTYINPRFLFINAIDFTYFAARVREHRKRHTAGNHLGKFFFLPYLVYKTTVRTY